jgi:RNA polymerase sigma factor (sigma-70 family)
MKTDEDIVRIAVSKFYLTDLDKAYTWDDILQDARMGLLKAKLKYPKLKGEIRDWTGFAIVCARREIINRWRENSFVKYRAYKNIFLGKENAPIFLDHNLPKVEEEIFTDTNWDEKIDFDLVIETLSPECQFIIKKRMNDVTYEDIAKSLGVTKQSVHKVFKNSIKRIKISRACNSRTNKATTIPCE